MTDQEQEILNKIKNRAICADAREVLKYVPDKVVDILVSDVPYNTGYEYEGYDDSKSEVEYWKMLYEVFTEVGRVLKDNSSIYVKQAEKNIHKTMDMLDTIANFKRLIVWQNISQQNPKDNYGCAFEVILYYIKGKPLFNEYAERRKSIDDVAPDSTLRSGKTNMKMWNLWNDIPRVSAGALCSKEAILEPNSLTKSHPCQFPEHLAARQILFSSNPGDLVLDPFSGSFTVAAAAKKYGRDFIACDIVKKYQEIGIERLRKIDEQVLPQNRLFKNIIP